MRPGPKLSSEMAGETPGSGEENGSGAAAEGPLSGAVSRSDERCGRSGGAISPVTACVSRKSWRAAGAFTGGLSGLQGVPATGTVLCLSSAPGCAMAKGATGPLGAAGGSMVSCPPWSIGFLRPGAVSAGGLACGCGNTDARSGAGESHVSTRKPAGSSP